MCSAQSMTFNCSLPASNQFIYNCTWAFVLNAYFPTIPEIWEQEVQAHKHNVTLSLGLETTRREIRLERLQLYQGFCTIGKHTIEENLNSLKFILL